MALDPDDVQALDARIEMARRSATAGGLRFQAVTLRGQADLFSSMARTLEAQADAIEDGRDEIPVRPVRLAVVPLEPEGSAAPEPDAGLIQPIELAQFGSAGIFTPAGGGEFTPEMAAFFDFFDDRLKMSPHFVTAINQAAAAELPASERTASLVGDMVLELRDAATFGPAEGGGDGGGE